MPVGKGSIQRASDAVRTEEIETNERKSLEQKSVESKGQPYFQLIAVEKLVETPKTWRKNVSATVSDSLLASIKKFGVLEPILVYQKEEGQYSILSGHQRVKAAKACSLTEVPAVVCSIQSQKEAKQVVGELHKEERNIGVKKIESKGGVKSERKQQVVREELPNYLL